jgi:hypothetical protein
VTDAHKMNLNPHENNLNSSSNGPSSSSDPSFPKDINFIDTIEDKAKEILMNGVKRRAVSPPEEIGSGGKAPKMVVNKLAKSLENNKKITARRKARRFPVKIKKSKIWSRLLNSEAGLSIAEWLALDKEAASEIIDGIRYLREISKIKKSVVMASPSKIGQSSKKTMDMDSGLLVNEVEIRDVTEQSEDSYSSSDESSSSTSMDDEVSVLANGSSFDKTRYYEEDLELSDTESVYRYPYNLQKMKASSPLRGVITINGCQVECIYDTGASVSVIGSRLAKKLGLIPNGDKLKLVGFNSSKESTYSNIVMDVPICVNGKIRPEHMCIEENSESDLCLLGVPWFENYGVSIDIQKTLILVPTSDGIMKIKGFTRHFGSYQDEISLNDRFSDLSKVKKVYQVQAEQKYTRNITDDLLESEYNEEHPKPKVNGILGEVIYDASNISIGVPDALVSVIEENNECFSEVSGLSKIKGYVMDIHLKENAIPVRNSPYRLSWSDQEILDAYVKEMLELDLIEPSMGTWTSSLFLLDKKEGGSKRVVADLRGANDQIVKTNFPVATVAELTEATVNAKVFSVFDCTSGYHQLLINPDHREVTGFITKSGTWRYKVCPQGITVGVAEYSRVVTDIFKDYIGKFIYNFLDDILVFSNSMEEHAEHLKLMFEACKKANLKLKRKKSFIGEDSVEYLGHILGAAGSSPCDRNIIKLKAFPPPRNVSEVRSFLGLSGYYRKYVQGYASIAAPLIKLTRKGTTFNWSETEQVAFEKLKNCLTSAPVLTYPDRNKVQVLSVDASNIGLGAVLSQVDNWESMENEQVISYASKAVRGATANLSIHHLESLAAVWGVLHYKHYLKGRKFILITDCSSLLYTFKKSKNTPKLNRWAACLLDYDFELRYRKGAANTSDPLSRRIIDLEKGDIRDIVRIV